MKDPTASRWTVRPATATDGAAAGHLHHDRIPGGFLSLLGTDFLALLYRRIALVDHSFLLVVDRGTTDRPDVVGFIAGSTDVRRLYRDFLLRDGPRAVFGAAPLLARRWRSVVETLRHGSGGGGGPGVELLAVAVDPVVEGTGVGEVLMASFLERASSEGSGKAHVVVGADNARAIRYYRRAGFVEVERFELHSGTESVLLAWPG